MSGEYQREPTERFNTERHNTERFDAEPRQAGAAHTAHQYPPLPAFLARRLLRDDEQVTFVRGPWFAPWWERHVTHISFILVAGLLAVAVIAAGIQYAGSLKEMPILPGVIALGLIFGSIGVTAFFCGLFTRLIVTDRRLILIQGYDVCRVWNIDDLPRRLLRYARRGGEERAMIDIDALQTMITASVTEKFSEAKTLMKFGKQLDQIRRAETDRS